MLLSANAQIHFLKPNNSRNIILEGRRSSPLRCPASSDRRRDRFASGPPITPPRLWKVRPHRVDLRHGQAPGQGHQQRRVRIFIHRSLRPRPRRIGSRGCPSGRSWFVVRVTGQMAGLATGLSRPSDRGGSHVSGDHADDQRRAGQGDAAAGRRLEARARGPRCRTSTAREQAIIRYIDGKRG